jgi:hypothetical protein
VTNIPRGKGPFPVVVLAHGCIDPAVYFRGQGMPRERVQLADAGYIALHVDHRNHASCDDDAALQRTFRLGCAVDVLNAVSALLAGRDVSGGRRPQAAHGATAGRSWGDRRPLMGRPQAAHGAIDGRRRGLQGA